MAGDLELCSCGLARYVLPGGVLTCEHCDGSDCCRYNAQTCDQCHAYAKAMAARC